MVVGRQKKVEYTVASTESECVLVKMGRKPCCAKQGLNKGAWSVEEDKILINYIQVHGDGKWRDLPQKAGLKRCGKSCRLRWLNYLRPDITRGNISLEEEQLIIRLHKLLGNRWSLIAGRLPGRTDNEIKNYWNSTLRKKLESDHDKNTPPYESKKNECSKNISVKLNAEERKPEPPKVFRTKAVRCTKVVIPGMLDCNQSVDNVGDNSQSSSARREDTNSVSDLFMDFDISGLLISDALSSAVSLQANEINENRDHDHNMVDGDPYHHGLINSMSCFPEYSDSAHEAKFEYLTMDEHTRPDYWMDGHPFKNNDLMDLKSLEFFLNSEDK